MALITPDPTFPGSRVVITLYSTAAADANKPGVPNTPSADLPAGDRQLVAGPALHRDVHGLVERRHAGAEPDLRRRLRAADGEFTWRRIGAAVGHQLRQVRLHRPRAAGGVQRDRVLVRLHGLRCRAAPLRALRPAARLVGHQSEDRNGLWNAADRTGQFSYVVGVRTVHRGSTRSARSR